MRFRIALIAACVVSTTPVAAQQRGISRGEAIQTAIARGARIGVALADTVLAQAGLITARARLNPSLTTSYSKSVPQYHFGVDIPVDFPALRQLRIRAAELGLQAAQLRYQFARA